VSPIAGPSHSLAHHLKCCSRDVQNTDIKSTEFEQVVNESRCASPYVNHVARLSIRNPANQIKGLPGVRLKPTDVLGGARGVDAVPM